MVWSTDEKVRTTLYSKRQYFCILVFSIPSFHFFMLFFFLFKEVPWTYFCLFPEHTFQWQLDGMDGDFLFEDSQNQVNP